MIKLLTVLSHFVGIFQSWPKNLMISCLFKYILTIVPMLWEGIILLILYFLGRNTYKSKNKDCNSTKEWKYPRKFNDSIKTQYIHRII